MLKRSCWRHLAKQKKLPARGHAEAVAVFFAREGASVSICDVIPVSELEATVGASIRAAGGKVICFQTDVSKEDQVSKMVQETIKKWTWNSAWTLT